MAAVELAAWVGDPVAQTVVGPPTETVAGCEQGVGGLAWCSRCGTCRCSYDEETGEREWDEQGYGPPECPIHSRWSQHPVPPTTRPLMLTLGEWADGIVQLGHEVDVPLDRCGTCGGSGHVLSRALLAVDCPDCRAGVVLFEVKPHQLPQWWSVLAGAAAVAACEEWAERYADPPWAVGVIRAGRHAVGQWLNSPSRANARQCHAALRHPSGGGIATLIGTLHAMVRAPLVSANQWGRRLENVLHIAIKTAGEEPVRVAVREMVSRQALAR